MTNFSLPSPGRISCSICHPRPVSFDKDATADGDWRITANPLAWGGSRPEILVLGFSKGPTQSGSLSRSPHDQIAFKGGRKNVGKILARVGLIPQGSPDQLETTVNHLIANKQGRFAFGSLIRCTVERRTAEGWTGTGGDMLGSFLSTAFGKRVATNCATRFLRDLPPETRLVLLFGMGTQGNYVKAARELLERTRPGQWRWVNEIAYTDGRVTFVHVEHFKSQGSLVNDWCGIPNPKKGNLVSPRSRFGSLAQQAVDAALKSSHQQ